MMVHELPPSFLDLVVSFATNGQEAEAGPGALTMTRRPDGSYDIQCCYQYVEETGPESAINWVVRQTGIYHHYRPATEQNILIFLHPRRDSPLELQIQSMVKKWGRDTPSQRWSLAHMSLFACYASGWRWYLKSLSSKVNQMAAQSLSLDYSKNEDYACGFGLFQQMHLLEDKILCVAPRLTSALDTIHSLQGLHQRWSKNDLNGELIGEQLRTLETQFRGVLAGIDMLEKRTGQLVKLLSAALSIKRQSSAVKVNQGIWLLARDSAGDSAAVRVITILTLVYLPASFTATLLGMNLFAFKGSDSNSSSFSISPKFWIFIAIAVPLTGVTLGAWMLIVQKYEKKMIKEWGEEDVNSRPV
ncbi:hypothetical protein N431DRAFT_495515 [Stipitochalara longipes BDJ]|nr:hypothetical protein N431DRAFT_495515 [Stipitochalara longipes BDJ]